MKRKTKIDIDDLIDFSSKLVNSNSSVGIRLSSGAALALPYLSTRTCLAAGISMPLDTANGAKDVGKVSALYKKTRRRGGRRESRYRGGIEENP